MGLFANNANGLPHTGRRILLVKWRGWPFIGKNKQQGQQTSGGVTESDSWWAGGPDANPLWQLLCCKVLLCQAGMSFYTHTRAQPHVQRPCCNTRQTRYNIPYQPERCFTRHTQLKEGRAAKTGDLRLLTCAENKKQNLHDTFTRWVLTGAHSAPVECEVKRVILTQWLVLFFLYVQITSYAQGFVTREPFSLLSLLSVKDTSVCPHRPCLMIDLLCQCKSLSLPDI